MIEYCPGEGECSLPDNFILNPLRLSVPEVQEPHNYKLQHYDSNSIADVKTTSKIAKASTKYSSTYNVNHIRSEQSSVHTLGTKSKSGKSVEYEYYEDYDYSTSNDSDLYPSAYDSNQELTKSLRGASEYYDEYYYDDSESYDLDHYSANHIRTDSKSSRKRVKREEMLIEPEAYTDSKTGKTIKFANLVSTLCLFDSQAIW